MSVDPRPAPAAPPRRRSDLGIRTVTGVALILVALVCLVWGQTFFWMLVTAACLVMLAEWGGLIRAERWQLWLALLGLFAALLLENPEFDIPEQWGLATLAGAIVLVLAATRNARLALGMAYAGLPGFALTYLHAQYDGIGLSLWTLAIVWATDIGAYFTGRRFGGPKLAPVISPNKTWSGLIGGIVSAVVAGLALCVVLTLPLALAGFAGVLAIAAQAGDLYESAMKRQAGQKDSGKILPGHGGVMDRLDGVVPVACLMAGIVLAGLI